MPLLVLLHKLNIPEYMNMEHIKVGSCYQCGWMAATRMKWVLQAFLATHPRCIKCKWSDRHHPSFQLTHYLPPIGVLVRLAGKPIAAGTWARA